VVEASPADPEDQLATASVGTSPAFGQVSWNTFLSSVLKFDSRAS
jgi:hypothetical protein